MKKIVRLTVILLVMTFVTCVSAAAAPAPYGFTYSDVERGRTCYVFYSYNTSTNAYEHAKQFYSKGNKMFNNSAVTICDVYASSGQYAGFDASGNFYVITPSQQLLKFGTSKKVLLGSGALRLAYNADSLATAVVTNEGWKSLSTLKPVTPTDNDDTPAPQPRAKNRVQMYTNSAGEMVYEAIQNGKLKLTLLVSKNGQNVLNKTNGIRLTDTLKGAKFIGFDTSYNVYLYEGSTLYRFKFGSWHSAQKVVLSGSFKSFTNDTNGFISKVVTTSDSYTIRQLVVPGRWKASKTYAVKKSDYITLYTKGTTNSYTLLYKNKTLSLNGKKIATNVSKYGFTTTKKAIYISGGKAYTCNLKGANKKLFCKNAKSLVFNSNMLVTKVKLKSGKCKAVK